MTLQDLIKLYRADSLDKPESQFCDDELLTIYANEAQDEACRRGQLLRDSSSSWCTLSVAAGAESVRLNPLAIRVLRAFVDGCALQPLHVDEMDAFFPGWQFQAVRNRPTHLITGVSTDQLYLWPRPDKEYTVNLTVQRLPKKPMQGCGDSPEIRPELHQALVSWMLYRAYSRTDGDLMDPAKAGVSLAKFEAEFGRKASGRNEEWVRAGDEMMPGPIA